MIKKTYCICILVLLAKSGLLYGLVGNNWLSSHKRVIVSKILFILYDPLIKRAKLVMVITV